jgi:sulfite exporter TauE/SafE
MTFIAILVASMIGSMHCVGMCGGFVAVARASGERAHLSHLLYHLGRLLTYCILGAISGYLGSRLDHSGTLIGLQRISVYLTAGLLIIFGVRSFFSGGVTLEHNRATQKLAKLFNVVVKIGERLGLSRAFLLGTCSTLLPCGWLYGFAAVAAMSGDALSGAITMLAFWLGTLPALAGLGELIGRITNYFGLNSSRVVSVLLVLAGISAILSHTMLMGGHHHH